MSSSNASEGRPRKGSRRNPLPGQAHNFKKSLRRLLGELRPDGLLFFFAMIMSTVSVVLSVIAPYLLGKATDLVFNGAIGIALKDAPSKEAAVNSLRAQGNEKLAHMLEAMKFTPGQGIDFTHLAENILKIILIYVLSVVISFFASLLIRRMVQNTGWRMRDKIQTKLESLPLSYMDRHSRGDLMSRVSNDVDNLTLVMNQTLSQIFQSILTIIGVCIMMLTISWKLTLLALLVIPFGAFTAGKLMKYSQPRFRQQWKSTGEVSGIVEEAMTGYEVATLYGLEDHFAENFEKSNNELYRCSFIAQFISNIVTPLMTFIGNVSYVVIAVGGGLLVASGSMSIGSIQAFIQYSRQFMQPVGQLAGMMNSVQSGVASAERIFEFLDAEEMPPDQGAHSLQESRLHAGLPSGDNLFTGRVVFDHVRFGYTPDKPVIKDLSLTVNPGQMAAIIGPTGAGKTTLVNLLMRFYDCDSGSISIDGVDIRDIHADELRSHVGMVLQDTWLFNGTVTENIAFGSEKASHEDVVDAARATAADYRIRQLPGGYDTVLEDDSDSISIGERQLLTIARAFIAHPDILILDEATSSVDTRTEVLLQKAMLTLRKGRTAFVIAHRLSTIRNADVIIVMDQGDVVEIGRHHDLMELNGVYAALYRAQSLGPMTSDDEN